jgi:queuine tRNA-ribosyltransferase
MGVGTPLDILEAVHRGVDMFDCIIPSQIAQRGGVYTSLGRLQLRRSLYKMDESPLDPDCDCATCRSYSRGYLHHLNKAEENLGWTLLTQHNLAFYHRLMREIRESILNDSFVSFYTERRERLALSDNTQEGAPPPRVRKQEPLQLGDYTLQESPSGFFSVRQISSGETMHSVSDPGEEAKRLYIEQSRLAQRLLEGPEGLPLVIWDVGLGAAHNAMAAIECFQSIAQTSTPRPLHIVSFEKDLDPLRLATKHPTKFPHLCHGAPHRILRDGKWTSNAQNVSWQLLEGDFLETLSEAPQPDLIFYDPFSFKTDSALWTQAAFRKVLEKCADHPAEFYTYSASTSVRVALLSAGFFVGPGVPTGPKTETTRAYSPHTADKPTLLGQEWLQRWDRSHAKFPADLEKENHCVFENHIRQHPQFALGVS